MTNAENMVKVLLQDGTDVETLWAVPVGDDLYRLDNSPFFVYRVSWEDVVCAERDSDGILCFSDVVQKSGNRTLRVITNTYDTTSPEAKPFLDGIINLGCSYEGFQPRLISINVPPEVELKVVAAYLIESGHNWEYADPKYEDLFPEPES
jgi:hypothetical protein